MGEPTRYGPLLVAWARYGALGPVLVVWARYQWFEHSIGGMGRLTAQGINQEWKRDKYVLAIRELQGSHTADVINTAIREILEECEIKQEVCHVIVRDGAANMKKAFEVTVRSDLLTWSAPSTQMTDPPSNIPFHCARHHQEWKRDKYVLAIRELQGSHTADVINTAIREFLKNVKSNKKFAMSSFVMGLQI
uniref:DUF659 domain-containing protein n=1 Tax=Ditylenchus dipsaci TaxID=166011 RepID=A0A915DR23_9BILA